MEEIMKKVMFTKLLLVSLTILMMSLSITHQTVIAEDEPDKDDIEGQITSQNYNNPAKVIDLELLNDSGEKVVPGTPLTPQESYTVRIEVYDPDTIGDLNSLAIKFFYFSGTPETPEDLATTFDATLGTEHALVMEWNGPSQTVDMVSAGSFTTWEILDFTVPTENLEANEFIFEVTFKISKIAHESDLEDLNWYFGTTINDGRLSLDSGSAAVDVVDYGLNIETGSSDLVKPSFWSMNWYGEVTVSKEASIAWNDVLAGKEFQEGQTLSGINFISNGDYHTLIKSSPTWDAYITPELAEIIFALPITTTELDVLLNKYNELFVPGTPPVETGTTPLCFVGLSYDKINQTALILEVAPWLEFQIHLPQSSATSNLTGASLVFEPDQLNSPGFTEQFFAIQYDFSPEDGVLPFYVGSEFVGFKPTADYLQTITPESGHDYEILLRLALSDVFQNASYEGKLIVQIVNP
jgi:hypothetical protein